MKTEHMLNVKEVVDDLFAESFKQIKTSIGNCGSKSLLVFKSC